MIGKLVTNKSVRSFDTYYTQAWKQTSGDPSGLTWNYRGKTLLYMVSSVTMARIMTRLLSMSMSMSNIYLTVNIKNK